MNKLPWKITLSDISISKKEENSVVRILRSKWLSMGEVTQKFEEEFKKTHRVKHAIAVTNCTAALHMANLALGLKAGDEAICPSLTFVATSNAILYAGAKPIFADIISPVNLNISPEDIEKKISKRTKSITVVHYAGYPCDMKKINSIAKKYKLSIIEDSSHAPLTKYQDRYLGTYGDIGCFSFFANKNMTTAEGGMLVTPKDDLAVKLKSLRSHGMTSLTLDRHKGYSYSYDVLDLGFNFRTDEIRSALGLVQLERLGDFNFKRRGLTAYYREKIKAIPQLQIAFNGFDLNEASCHIFPVLLKDRGIRDDLQSYLKSEGIQTSIHYPPIHKFSYYSNRFGRLSLPKTEDAASRVLTLPLYPALTKTQINFIIRKIEKYFCAGFTPATQQKDNT